MQRKNRTATLPGILVALVAAGPAAAQTTAPAATPQVEAADPLTREGSFMLAARGTMYRGSDGWWSFRFDGETEQGQTEMPLMPCKLLASMEQLVETTPDKEMVFELTGQVFVYHGRNYLLPTHSPRVTGYAPPAPQPRAPQPEADGQEPQESVEDILRELDHEVGPVVKNPGAAAVKSTRSGPYREGTKIVWRRGWLSRKPGGAWSFAFEADAGALGDPPMILLPCLLLERMEAYGQSRPAEPLLLTGVIYRYGRETYLLPSAFQVPRDRTPLQP